MPSAVLLISMVIAVVVDAAIIRPPFMPFPMMGHLATPFMAPFVTPFTAPIVPFFRQQRRTRVAPRPKSTPFVLETPEFMRRELDPVYINVVENPDPLRDIVYIDDRQAPMFLDQTFIGDGFAPGMGLDSNLLYTNSYGSPGINQGPTVGQVVNGGQLTSDINFLASSPTPGPLSSDVVGSPNAGII